MPVNAQLATASVAIPNFFTTIRALAPVGRTFFAIAIFAFGVLHLVYGDFVTRVVPWWPDWVPARGFLVAVLGISLIAASVAILTGARIREVTTSLGALLLLSFVFLGIPLVLADSVLGSFWTTAGKALALSGGAFLVGRSVLGPAPDPFSASAALQRAWAMGPWFFGAFLALCGVQHFVHVEFVTTLVPAWMPGGQRVWTYVTGVLLVAGGIGVVVPRTARLAGLLSGLMIFAWVFMVHIPLAVAAPGSPNAITPVFEALAMSGIAFLIAAAPPSAAGSHVQD